jgi:hypothetical protein
VPLAKTRKSVANPMATTNVSTAAMLLEWCIRNNTDMTLCHAQLRHAATEPWFHHAAAAAVILIGCTGTERLLELIYWTDPRHGASHLTKIGSSMATHLLSLAAVQLGANEIWRIVMAISVVSGAGAMFCIWIAAGFLLPRDLEPLPVSTLARFLAGSYFRTWQMDYARVMRQRDQRSGDSEIDKGREQYICVYSIVRLLSKLLLSCARPATTCMVYILHANYEAEYNSIQLGGLLVLGLCVALLAPSLQRGIYRLQKDHYDPTDHIAALTVYECVDLPWARVLLIFMAQLLLCYYLTTLVVHSNSIIEHIQGYPSFFYAGMLMALCFDAQTGVSFETHVPREADTVSEARTDLY